MVSYEEVIQKFNGVRNKEESQDYMGWDFIILNLI
jgi:hypothetical protein